LSLPNGIYFLSTITAIYQVGHADLISVFEDSPTEPTRPYKANDGGVQIAMLSYINFLLACLLAYMRRA